MSDTQQPSTQIVYYRNAIVPQVASLYPIPGMVGTWHINFTKYPNLFFKQLGLTSWVFEQARSSRGNWVFYRYRTNLALEEKCKDREEDVGCNFVVSAWTILMFHNSDSL
jgi:hypothetical protein